jgi:hypothetical protein
MLPWRASAPPILVRDERHRVYAHGLAFAAHFGVDLVLGQGVVGGQVSHGERLIGGGRHRAAGHGA